MSEDPVSGTKRPGWVWVITILMLLSASWTLFSFYLIRTGAIPLAPEQRAIFDSMSALDYGLSIATGLLNISGAILLFLMRKAAVPLFGTAFALGVVGNAWTYLVKGMAPVVGTSVVIGSLVGLAIAGTIFLYARSLRARGMLR